MQNIKLKSGGTIINFVWRSGRETVGLVLVQAPEKYGGTLHAYIGAIYKVDKDLPKILEKLGPHISYNHEEFDAVYIAEWGAKLSYDEAVGFFPELKDKREGFVYGDFQ